MGGGDYSRRVRGVGAIIQGRRLFQIIPPKRGDYSSGRLIEGRLLFEEIRYLFLNPEIPPMVCTLFLT